MHQIRDPRSFSTSRTTSKKSGLLPPGVDITPLLSVPARFGRQRRNPAALCLAKLIGSCASTLFPTQSPEGNRMGILVIVRLWAVERFSVQFLANGRLNHVPSSDCEVSILA